MRLQWPPSPPPPPNPDCKCVCATAAYHVCRRCADVRQRGDVMYARKGEWWRKYGDIGGGGLGTGAGAGGLERERCGRGNGCVAGSKAEIYVDLEGGGRYRGYEMLQEVWIPAVVEDEGIDVAGDGKDGGRESDEGGGRWKWKAWCSWCNRGWVGD